MKRTRRPCVKPEEIKITILNTDTPEECERAKPEAYRIIYRAILEKEAKKKNL
jgi:hypothetical protein